MSASVRQNGSSEPTLEILRGLRWCLDSSELTKLKRFWYAEAQTYSTSGKWDWHPLLGKRWRDPRTGKIEEEEWYDIAKSERVPDFYHGFLARLRQADVPSFLEGIDSRLSSGLVRPLVRSYDKDFEVTAIPGIQTTSDNPEQLAAYRSQIVDHAWELSNKITGSLYPANPVLIYLPFLRELTGRKYLLASMILFFESGLEPPELFRSLNRLHLHAQSYLLNWHNEDLVGYRPFSSASETLVFPALTTNFQDAVMLQGRDHDGLTEWQWGNLSGESPNFQVVRSVINTLQPLRRLSIEIPSLESYPPECFPIVDNRRILIGLGSNLETEDLIRYRGLLLNDCRWSLARWAKAIYAARKDASSPAYKLYFEHLVWLAGIMRSAFLGQQPEGTIELTRSESTVCAKTLDTNFKITGGEGCVLRSVAATPSFDGGTRFHLPCQPSVSFLWPLAQFLEEVGRSLRRLPENEQGHSPLELRIEVASSIENCSLSFGCPGWNEQFWKLLLGWSSGDGNGGRIWADLESVRIDPNYMRYRLGNDTVEYRNPGVAIDLTVPEVYDQRLFEEVGLIFRVSWPRKDS